MLVHLRRAIVLSVVLIVLCLVYTGVGDGHRSGRLQVSGERLAHQARQYGDRLRPHRSAWTGPKWFQGTSDDARAWRNPARRATDLAPEQLYEQVVQAEETLKRGGRHNRRTGLVTGSGSGIDPDISPADAMARVDTVTKANNLPVSTVRALVEKYSAPVYLGVFGSPYVNVMSLNMALAALTSGSRLGPPRGPPSALPVGGRPPRPVAAVRPGLRR